MRALINLSEPLPNSAYHPRTVITPKKILRTGGIIGDFLFGSHTLDYVRARTVELSTHIELRELIVTSISMVDLLDLLGNMQLCPESKLDLSSV